MSSHPHARLAIGALAIALVVGCVSNPQAPGVSVNPNAATPDPAAPSSDPTPSPVVVPPDFKVLGVLTTTVATLSMSAESYVVVNLAMTAQMPRYVVPVGQERSLPDGATSDTFFYLCPHPDGQPTHFLPVFTDYASASHIYTWANTGLPADSLSGTLGGQASVRYISEDESVGRLVFPETSALDLTLTGTGSIYFINVDPDDSSRWVTHSATTSLLPSNERWSKCELTTTVSDSVGGPMQGLVRENFRVTSSAAGQTFGPARIEEVNPGVYRLYGCLVPYQKAGSRTRINVECVNVPGRLIYTW